jgi:hypothetical protein
VLSECFFDRKASKKIARFMADSTPLSAQNKQKTDPSRSDIETKKIIWSGITLSIFALVQKYSHLLQEAKDRKNTLFVFLLGASRRFGAAQPHNPVSKTKNRPRGSDIQIKKILGADYVSRQK